MAPPRKRRPAPAKPEANGGLTETEQAEVLELAAAELLSTVNTNPKVAALGKRYPNEAALIFMAGCRAGVVASSTVIGRRLDKLAP